MSQASDNLWPSPEAIASILEAETGQLAASIKDVPMPKATKPESQKTGQNEQNLAQTWLLAWRELLWQQFQENARIGKMPLEKAIKDYTDAVKKAQEKATAHFFAGMTYDAIASEITKARASGDTERAKKFEGELQKYQDTVKKLVKEELPDWDVKAIGIIEKLPDIRTLLSQVVIDDVNKLRDELGKQEDEIGAIIVQLMSGNTVEEKFGDFVKRLEDKLKADDRIKNYVQAINWDELRKKAVKHILPQVTLTKTGEYAPGSEEAEDLAKANANFDKLTQSLGGKGLGSDPVRVFAIDDQGNQNNRGYATSHRGKNHTQAIRDIVAEIIDGVGTDKSLIPGDVRAKAETGKPVKTTEPGPRFSIDARPEEIASHAVRTIDYGREGAEARRREEREEKPLEGDKFTKDLTGAVYRISIPFTQDGRARTLRAYVCLVQPKKELSPEARAKIDPYAIVRDRLAPGEASALQIYVYHDGKMVSNDSTTGMDLGEPLKKVSGSLVFKDPREVMADVAMKILVGRQHEVTPDISREEIKKQAREISAKDESGAPGKGGYGIWRVDVPYSWIDFDDPNVLAMKRPESSGRKRTTPQALEPKGRAETVGRHAVSKKTPTEELPGEDSGLAAARKTETVQLYINFGKLSDQEARKLIDRDAGKKDIPGVSTSTYAQAQGMTNAWYWQQKVGGHVQEVVWEAGEKGIQANRVEIPEKIFATHKDNPKKIIYLIATKVSLELNIHDGEIILDKGLPKSEDVIRIGIRHSARGGKTETKATQAPYKLSDDEQKILQAGEEAAERLRARWDAGKSKMSEEERNEALHLLRRALEAGKKTKGDMTSVEGGLDLPEEFAWTMVYVAKDPGDPASVQAARDLAKKDYAAERKEWEAGEEESRWKSKSSEEKHAQKLTKMGDALKRLEDEEMRGGDPDELDASGDGGVDVPDAGGAEVPAKALPGFLSAPSKGVGESKAFLEASRLISESKELIRRLRGRIRK